MLFSSPVFFAFFICYFIIHLLCPLRYRIYLIIIGSAFFYSWWKIEYSWLPFALTGIAFLGVLWIERAASEATRRRRTIATVVALFIPLVFFKYTDFLYRDVYGLFFSARENLLGLPLPLGVSFVTFTLTAFVVNVARRQFPPHTPLTTLAGYVLFFPHLIAGPILRPDELIPQLERPAPASAVWPVANLAVAIFTLGLVKKLVFADQISELVDAVYNIPGIPSGPEALFALYGFSVQIYCDFSGYTDMAIALAMLLGIRLPNNFARPYAAPSIIDFWRRWHITLSFWLRDYLYISLGGNRHGRTRELFNILVTMALGGLWHGANWTFVIWGVLHGCGVAIAHTVRRWFGATWLDRMPRWFATLLTFHFVTVLWVFFRAPDLAKASDIVAGLGFARWNNFADYVSANTFPVLLIAIFFLMHGLDDHAHVERAVRWLRPEVLWPLIALFWTIAITVSQGSSARFVYFDF